MHAVSLIGTSDPRRPHLNSVHAMHAPREAAILAIDATHAAQTVLGGWRERAAMSVYALEVVALMP